MLCCLTSEFYQSCDQYVTVNVPMAVLRSPTPATDGIYAYDTICLWILMADNDKAIKLEFLYMDLQTKNQTTFTRMADAYCDSYVRVSFFSIVPKPMMYLCRPLDTQIRLNKHNV